MLDFLSGLPLVDLGMDLFKQDRAEQMQEDQQNFNADQAAAARGWQEYMRGSAYQATVEDMKKAGLNPMLAYSQGASATPGTNTATSGIASTPPRTGTFAAGVQTAAQVENVHAQTEKLKAETQNIKDENPNIRGIQGIQNQTLALLREQAAQTESYRYLNDEQRRLVHQEIKNAIEENKYIIARTGITEVDKVLRQLSVPRAQNEAEAQKSDYMKYIAPYTGELGKLIHSASEAKEAFQPSTRSYRRQR